MLTEVAAELAVRHGWEMGETRAGQVPASIPDWPPFPDTNPALVRLRDAGVRLGILSNIDADLLDGTLRHFEVPFDRLVTAESLRSYKPARAHFDAGRRWVEESGGRVSTVAPRTAESGEAAEVEAPAGGAWVHVAQSLFHDIEPATGLGISTVWVNRKDEPRSPGAWPVHIAADLSAAVDWLLADRD